MTPYAARVAAHRRLTILRFLQESPEYTSNISILTDICNDFGIASTRDQVSGELAWLSEAGLLALENATDFMIAKLSARGSDVALGRARHPGVARASLGG